MCIVCKGKFKEKGTAQLKIKNCYNIRKVPRFREIKELYLDRCPNLTEIAEMDCVESIYCYFCPNLVKIPKMKRLKTLVCHICPKLTEIDTSSVTILSCSWCDSLTKIPSSDSFICMGCPWIENDNTNFEENIKCLIILQKFFKKHLFFYRLKKYLLSRKFLDWYYSIDGPGGKNAIRRLEKRRL